MSSAIKREQPIMKVAKAKGSHLSEYSQNAHDRYNVYGNTAFMSLHTKNIGLQGGKKHTFFKPCKIDGVMICDLQDIRYFLNNNAQISSSDLLKIL